MSEKQTAISADKLRQGQRCALPKLRQGDASLCPSSSRPLTLPKGASDESRDLD